MDNVTFAPPAIPNPCIIKLDQSQYAAYQLSRLEIHSPEGKFLTNIGKNLTHLTDEDAMYQLWYQACFLEVLFDQIQERMKLPQQAVNSIVKIIDRINGHLKKQITM